MTKPAKRLPTPAVTIGAPALETEEAPVVDEVLVAVEVGVTKPVLVVVIVETAEPPEDDVMTATAVVAALTAVVVDLWVWVESSSLSVM
jgi:hypothetical protein